MRRLDVAARDIYGEGVTRPGPPFASSHRALQAASAGPYVVSRPVRLANGAAQIDCRRGSDEVGSVRVWDRNARSVYVTDLQVEADHRRQGLGQRLIAGAAQEALRRRRQAVELECEDDGSGSLVRWYRELGFHQVGTTEREMPLLRADARRLVAQGKPRSRRPPPFPRDAQAPARSAQPRSQRPGPPFPRT